MKQPNKPVANVKHRNNVWTDIYLASISTQWNTKEILAKTIHILMKEENIANKGIKVC